MSLNQYKIWGIDFDFKILEIIEIFLFYGTLLLEYIYEHLYTNMYRSKKRSRNGWKGVRGKKREMDKEGIKMNCAQVTDSL